ncbi:HutD family protein [Bradyrhizobium sp. Ash2021]|uniref:HutD/Ves family protein n=1 Tax=Bradyrhizobium sp. Ash2021 TaxID=2954771 RepID=UPI0028162187|nr:HutD family protein [Bradyrhizobium sp. Ash2021]WMT72626.1 HutD family protein [Bradyrhizobium sp. Ash2021]
MNIIRAGSCRTTPWKNGGGSTTEIVAEPPGASLDDFDWRISMARVATDGPFSEFAGIDRTLAVINGKGLMLTIGGNAPIRLERGSDPISFAGDFRTSARLTAGEITDLNVMTRRSRFSHRLRRIGQPTSCKCGGKEIAVVLSLNGSTTLASDQDIATLDHGDAAILSGAREDSFRIVPTRSSDCYLVLLHEHQAT